jgi:hypothetical protein
MNWFVGVLVGVALITFIGRAVESNKCEGRGPGWHYVSVGAFQQGVCAKLETAP